MKSKLINLFLLEGTADGRIKCTSNSRTEIVFKIPRKDLAKCKGRSELENAGVYILFGEEDGRPTVYIGQAGGRKNGKGILSRLNEHDRSPDKNFWTEAIVLTTLDNSFGATEISWLEHKFCEMAIKAAQFSVKNGNDPSPGNITEEKKSDLKEHAEFAQLILSTLGYKIFSPQQKNSQPTVKSDEEIFTLSRNIKALGRTITAYMKRTTTGYKVLAGSEISPLDEKTSLALQKRRRDSKISDGRLLVDEEFSSPSAAAKFITGNAAEAGPDVWKTRDGVPLKNFLQGGN